MFAGKTARHKLETDMQVELDGGWRSYRVEFPLSETGTRLQAALFQPPGSRRDRGWTLQ
jgi:hypothetical protein